MITHTSSSSHRLKVRFVDMPCPTEEHLVYKILSRNFTLDMHSKPDFIISGGLGMSHLKYDDCVKLVWIGENYVPDFNWFDYAIGFDYLDFGDRYLRAPLYAFYREFADIDKRTRSRSDALLNRKFCSFVVSASGGNPIRRKFFEALSKYKKVDSGGRWLNNIGGPVSDKAAFISGYKFNIAFENSDTPGYVTEKIMQAFAAQTVPIYWGDPNVENDFRIGSFVRVADESDIDRAISEIIRLDQDDDAYMKMATAPCLAIPSSGYYEEKLEAFLLQIFSQAPEKAFRRNKFGYQARQRKNIIPILRCYEMTRKCAWFGYNLIRGKCDLGAFKE